MNRYKVESLCELSKVGYKMGGSGGEGESYEWAPKAGAERVLG